MLSRLESSLLDLLWNDCSDCASGSPNTPLEPTINAKHRGRDHQLGQKKSDATIRPNLYGTPHNAGLGINYWHKGLDTLVLQLDIDRHISRVHLDRHLCPLFRCSSNTRRILCEHGTACAFRRCTTLRREPR